MPEPILRVWHACLESGRKVEVWVRTDSMYIRDYINPAHKDPDCIMEPKKVL